jgi:hypothetical protein
MKLIKTVSAHIVTLKPLWLIKSKQLQFSNNYSDFSEAFSRNTSLKKIMPGQIPVTAEIRKNVAGRYNIQCTTSNPVNQIPDHNIRPTNRKKAFVGKSILSTIDTPEF